MGGRHGIASRRPPTHTAPLSLGACKKDISIVKEQKEMGLLTGINVGEVCDTSLRPCHGPCDVVPLPHLAPLGVSRNSPQNNVHGVQMHAQRCPPPSPTPKE